MDMMPRSVRHLLISFVGATTDTRWQMESIGRGAIPTCSSLAPSTRASRCAATTILTTLVLMTRTCSPGQYENQALQSLLSTRNIQSGERVTYPSDAVLSRSHSAVIMR
jgi:hypothetical protein